MKEQGNYKPELIKNRIRNTAIIVIVNIGSVVITSIGPFFIRTLMIYNIGDEYAGLQSFLVSIISLLNMTELGLSSAVTFFLYKPLAEGDTEKTSHFLNFLKRIYRKIGITILVIGLLITPLLTQFIKGDIPADANVHSIFIILLCATCIQYFVAPDLLVLVNASQQGYISGGITIIGCLALYLMQTAAIVIFDSFFLYFVAILIQCILDAFLRWYCKKYWFRDIYPSGELEKKEKKQLKKHIISLLGHQMDDKLLSSVDSVILSTILGLHIVTIYSNYMYVVSAVSMLLVSIFTSITAAMGNAFVTEKPESNYIRFKAVLWLNGVIVVWAVMVMFCLFQPFMKLWMGYRLLEINTVVLFCLYFYVTMIRRTVLVFKNANGMWWEDRYKPYVSMVVNLIIDIVLVKLIGLNGALLSSIICVFLIEMPWEASVLYREYFRKKTKNYIMAVIKFLVFGIIGTGGMYIICEKFLAIWGITAIITRGIIITIIYILIIILIFRRSEEFKIWKDSLKILIRR